jgi:hypothetical protein
VKSITSEIELPELKAYAPTSSITARFPDTGYLWFAPCHFCGNMHVHCAGEGPRRAHCHVHGVEQPGYRLVYAGIAPPDVIAAILKWLGSRATVDNMSKHDPNKWTRDLIEAANEALATKEKTKNAA